MDRVARIGRAGRLRRRDDAPGRPDAGDDDAASSAPADPAEPDASAEPTVRPEPAVPAQVLLVANAYPSDGSLYRNAFIHRRVLAYLDAGITVEVFYLHPPVTEPYAYVFDGVRVTVGNAAAYEHRIAEQPYRAVLVHFASPDMVQPIVRHAPGTPVIVWVHGFEAEAWHRRWFTFTGSAAEIRAAVAKDDTYYRGQLTFMAWLLTTDELDVQVVHVSEWFRRHVVEPDVGVPTRRPHVIPNVVDTDLFPYVPKRPDDRLRILSVRPYASRKYANDQTVAAIVELSTRPFFDRLAFTVRGEGALFDQTVRPLADLANVSVERGFLRQEDIATLHADHGVFLAPTRFDSQGVSMCEAMSSGLVPVSTRITAIPEFVEDRVSGMLARPEDPVDLADQIELLYYNPELYLSLSERAATRTREQCGFDATVGREIALIGADT
ncbi:glycosyltransferase family 4 protein [Cellulomonas sp. ATA003]|uniref:glycosyltransferase family 4 protein n=1 Tax=Cellulomonas sp. ATA003 TaxID=3073064 RepID=UPI002873B17B|nr:glycosyltransferase family 4 protein [Cellulomonas sp. ATA003]WNB85201.1 glycosyltransferase family 4 protein [Cellulomonas sp. ATA003]